MADTTALTKHSLTRGARFGLELRIRNVYGCSPLASKIWLAYMAALGMRYPMVAEMLEIAAARGRRPFDNLHGEQVRERKFTYGQRLVRQAIAREARGERFALLQRQAG